MMMRRANNIDKCMEDCELEAQIGGMAGAAKKGTQMSVRVVNLASGPLIFSVAPLYRSQGVSSTFALQSHAMRVIAKANLVI